MKQRILYGIFALVMLGVIGCQQDPKSEETTIVTTEVSSITGSTAVGGGIIDKSAATITKKGICWAKKSMPTITDSVAYASEGGLGAYTCMMTNLEDCQTYYVRAFASNNAGVIYGEEISFTTAKMLKVTTISAKDILGNCAMAGGKIDADSDTTIVRRGLCWSTEKGPTINDSIVYSEENKDSEYTIWMRNLQSSTAYYYRAFVINAAGIFYGEEKMFRTLDNPVLAKTALGKVNLVDNQYKIACVGNIVAAVEGVPVQSCGFCWAKFPNPTVDANKIILEKGVETGEFKDTISVAKEEGVVYYVRSFVISDNGAAYGEEEIFTTWTFPTLSIFNAYSITSSSATEGAVITSDGSAPIKEKGFCWTVEEGVLPTKDDNISLKVDGENTIFYGKMVDLTPSTTYYVRAYVTNEVGTAYSDVFSFTTKAK